jgi:hypothetical protein
MFQEKILIALMAATMEVTRVATATTMVTRVAEVTTIADATI